jgi:hypothetical protein
MVSLLGIAALVGCAGQTSGEQAQALASYPGAREKIVSYYDANAVENDWDCTDVQMDGIARARVIQESPDTVVMAIHYDFQPGSGPPRGGECQGFGTRVFTLNKAGNTLDVAKMSGEQRGMSRP